jgi:endo-1,4-beta-D-glucanase Y
MSKIPKSKTAMLVGIVLVWLAFAALFQGLIYTGVIERAAPTLIEQYGNDSSEFGTPSVVSARLSAAQQYFNNTFVQPNGHVDLYEAITVSNETNTSQFTNTNSEAVSYRLLIAAQNRDKEAFDQQLNYIEEYVLHPYTKHMMWRLEENDTAIGEGQNIASDADLRAIKALLLAEEYWGDERYTEMIDTLALGVEKLAITSDGYLAPYGGASGAEDTWTAEEVWLGYEDFTVMEALAERRGATWQRMYDNMKRATLNAQLYNGLYNSQLTESRVYGNGIDGGGYSINSLWIMVRSAESGDPDLMASANASLAFYKKEFERNTEIYTLYDSTGNALSQGDSPWVYALVGRAAVALGDQEFADKMIEKLLEKQVADAQDPLYGAFPEGTEQERRVGQFTMQESIITIQDYLRMKAQY